MIAVGWWAAIFPNRNDNNGGGMSEDARGCVDGEAECYKIQLIKRFVWS